jgi:NADPH:quinone reductase-like Zn-dependent oxidoreductase
MKAFTTLGDGIAALKLGERPTPQPGPDEILVKMTAAALNFRDLLVINGTGSWKPRAPRIPVLDGVGVVVAVGDRVARFRTGDRVVGIFTPKWLDGELTSEKSAGALGGAEADGVLAEYRVFDEQAVVGVPAPLTDVEAATLPDSAVTAWHAVRRRSRVQSGNRVLIQGTGGVSTFALRSSTRWAVSQSSFRAATRNSKKPGHWAPWAPSTTKACRPGRRRFLP